jgi:hypothetical protein
MTDEGFLFFICLMLRMLSVWSCLVNRMEDNIKIGNKSFESVEYLQYLETTPAKQNCIHEEIKRSLNTGNDFLHSLQNFLSSDLLSKNI